MTPPVSKLALTGVRNALILENDANGYLFGCICCVDKNLEGGRVWIHLQKSYDDVLLITDICKNISTSQLQICPEIEKRVLYLVKYTDNNLYRATILETQGTNATVYCFDWGFMGDVNCSNVYCLPENVTLSEVPPLALPVVVFQRPIWPFVLNPQAVLHVERTYLNKEVKLCLTGTSVETPGFLGNVYGLEDDVELRSLMNANSIDTRCPIM